MQGMLRFDESDSSRISWTNQTLGPGSSGISVPGSVAGGMVYLPVGKGGVLLLLGGSNVSRLEVVNSKRTAYTRKGCVMANLGDVIHGKYWCLRYRFE